MSLMRILPPVARASSWARCGLKLDQSFHSRRDFQQPNADGGARMPSYPKTVGRDFKVGSGDSAEKDAPNDGSGSLIVALLSLGGVYLSVKTATQLILGRNDANEPPPGAGPMPYC